MQLNLSALLKALLGDLLVAVLFEVLLGDLLVAVLFEVFLVAVVVQYHLRVAVDQPISLLQLRWAQLGLQLLALPPPRHRRRQAWPQHTTHKANMLILTGIGWFNANMLTEAGFGWVNANMLTQAGFG